SSGSRMTSQEYTPSLEQSSILIMPHTRPLPTWLPVPPAPGLSRQSTLVSKKSRLSFRSACATEFRFERALMFVLALAGGAGIAAGFSWLVDLVQHWAVFNAGVGQFIQ